jgi:glycogen debranching enzyme
LTVKLQDLGLSEGMIRRRWDSAWSDLQGLLTPTGLHASEDQTGLYPAVFGRDTLWTVLMLLEAAERGEDPAFLSRVHRIAEDALTPLIDHQAVDTVDTVEAQPGKLPHAVWTGAFETEVAGLPLSDGVTYCGFDQTFLFVVLGARLLKHELPEEWRSKLSAAVVQAVRWALDPGLSDPSGLAAYRRRDPANPIHQVWKDSFDSVTHGGYDIPPLPVSWIEVQGYAFEALRAAADLRVSRIEDLNVRPSELLDRAGRLQAAVEEAFWLPREGIYAAAVDGQGRPIPMVTSNAGHALWGGLPTADQAERVVARLLQPDLMTMFGLRTLSSADRFFESSAYHRGTVWPFDNAVVAMGFVRYGYEDAAMTIAGAVTRALDLLHSSAELYGVVPRQALVDPRYPDSQSALSSQTRGPDDVIMHRRFPPQNTRQAFTAGGQLFLLQLLASAGGIRLPAG